MTDQPTNGNGMEDHVMGVNETPNWVLRVHAGNPKLARIFGLSIKQMPAHEGGGWYMSITDAQRIMRSTHIDELAAAAQSLLDANPYYFPEGNFWGDRLRDILAKIKGDQ